MFGTRSFTYNAENQLLTGPNSTTLSYDPVMRLYQTVAGGTTVRMAYDGLDRIAEYACPDPCGGDGANVLKRRYVHGPGIDQPLVWYEGAGTSDRRFLSSDERGSIISVTDSSGALLRINRYDEYGNPQGTNLGLWGYTGQAWLPGMGGWYYKARIYDRELGRFLQTDPAGGTNLYAYVGNDPIGHTDPSGMMREMFGLAGDDMSRFIDVAPRGTGRGTRSWDWGGQMAMSEAWYQASLSYMSHTTGIPVGCLLTCSLDQVYAMATGHAVDMAIGSIAQSAEACAGRYNCDDWLSRDMARKVAALLNDSTYRTDLRYAWMESLRLGLETGFGGIGFDNFQPTTDLIVGSWNGISRRQMDFVASTGAIIFTHTHPNPPPYPQGPSLRSDVPTFAQYGFFGVIVSHNGLYFFDATATRRRR